jgi:hypothetical protein
MNQNNKHEYASLKYDAGLFSRKSHPFGALFMIILFLTALLIAIVFLFKNISRQRLPKETTIDTIQDYRGLGYTGQRKIATDKKGNLYIAYRKDYNNRSETFVVHAINNSGKLQISGTDNPAAIVEKGTEQRVPSIAVDSKGTLHTVWYGSDNPEKNDERQIKYIRSEDQGKTWTSWRNISSVNGFSEQEIQWQEHPSLLVGSDDTLYVVWEGKDEQNSQQQIKFSKSNNHGNSWTQWKNINPTKSNTQSRPSLVEDENGLLYLFMYSAQNTQNDLQQIQYASSENQGETWSAWKTISDPNFDSRHVSAVVDSDNIIQVAWRAQTQKDGPSQIIYSSFSPATAQWTNPMVVAQSPRYQFFPSIGADAIGTTYIAWMETADSSDFPREDPQGGSGFVSFLNNGVFSKPLILGKNSRDLYPNVPNKINDALTLPIIYGEQSLDKKSLNVKMRFLSNPT